MDRERTVVMVTCSPLEVHGPHLPVVADNLEAEAISIRAMEHLVSRHPEIEFLHLPAIYVSTDVVPKAGSVAFRTSTLIAVLEDLGRSLCAQGFQDIWVASFHGGPRHFVSIETAAHRVNQRHGGRMVSAFSRLINELTGGGTDLADVLGHVSGISASDLEGDTHAGAVETSLLLHLLGDRVNKDYRALDRVTVNTDLEQRGLPPLREGKGRPTLRGLLRGFKHKLKYFERQTYAGAPAVGSPEAGAQILEELSRLTANALSRVWTRELSPEDCHSPLWPVRWVFTTPIISQTFMRLMRYQTQVW